LEGALAVGTLGGQIVALDVGDERQRRGRVEYWEVQGSAE